MRITIPVSEVKTLIRDMHRLSATDEVVIEGVEAGPNPMAYPIAISTALREFPGITNKIAAIKRARELCPGLGLGDAKVAIENPDKAILHFFRTGSVLPYA